MSPDKTQSTFQQFRQRESKQDQTHTETQSHPRSRQTLPVTVPDTLTIPDPWRIHADSAPPPGYSLKYDKSIMLLHPDGFLAELARVQHGGPDTKPGDTSSSAHSWIACYQRKDETVHCDGTNRPHNSAQGAVDSLTDWITSLRARARNRAHRRQDKRSVTLPDQLGIFSLSQPANKESFEYSTQIISGKTILGIQYRDRAVKTRYYDQTETWTITDNYSFHRLSTAISALRRLLKVTSHDLLQQERAAIRRNSIKPTRIPDRHADLRNTN